MNIALKANIYHPEIETLLNRCLDQVRSRGVKAWVHSDILALVKDRSGVVLIEEEGIPPEVNLVIALGGDGTVLGVARSVGEREIPIFAVNLGNFGFLTSSSVDNFVPDLDRILAGNFEVEDRMVLKAEISGSNGTVYSSTALNDIVLHKGTLARPIVLNIKAGGEQVGFFPADGVIVSTPTGSTAYSLSAGGPIIYPLMDAITITPICPHTLAVRPLVVPSNIPVSLSELSAHQEVILTFDGQLSRNVSEENIILVTRASHVTKMIKPFEGSFFSRLRGKLKWGERERI